MLKNIRHFFSEYRALGVLLIITIIALSLDIAGKDSQSHLILGISSLVMVIPMLKDMWLTLQEGRYGVDILAATAIITSVLLHEYWAGIIIVLMLTGGKALEDYAENRAKKELSALLDRAPTKATVLRKKQEVSVPVAQLKVGDHIIVKTGEVIPVDGFVIEGATSIDESSLTGESLPVMKEKDGTVMSGSINLEGSIIIEATHTSKDSQYETIIALVKNAANAEAPFVRLTDRYSIPFTIISFAIATAMWIITKDANRFLQILVVATPCPLLLAAPIALISGMSRSAKHGAIIRNGTVLEKLASVKAFGFDKTGTLTQGKPKIVDIVSLDKTHDKNSIISLAAALESKSGHVLARTITDYATNENITLAKISKVKERSGHGLEATYQGKIVRIGNMRFMETEGVKLDHLSTRVPDNGMVSFVSVNSSLLGFILFEDEIRVEAKQTLQALRHLGIKETIMVTGDKESVAQAIADQAGIDTVKSECLPADKIIAIEQLRKKHGSVAFVGDGVNDAPVLTSSDVGIALGARGSTAASEAADIVILLDDVSKVAVAREIATRTFQIARQSILVGIGLSFVLMAIFATGKFKPSLGAALQELVDVTVIINALRAHRGKLKFAQQSTTKR
ncbi:MAG TPA: heavy metal translocating P-type ATPase [Candidatus Saccharibacteria bacterium]|jgi:heavy metal translocating P-type ATPase|nr:heavy metal translocating P-type ATPase [Candidatus Saccharibacteria bacterium]